MTYGSKSYSELGLVVRGTNPAGFIGPVKEAVQRLGAGRPVHDVRLLSDRVADASADTRFALFVLGSFAVLARRACRSSASTRSSPTRPHAAPAKSPCDWRSARTPAASSRWS